MQLAKAMSTSKSMAEKTPMCLTIAETMRMNAANGFKIRIQ